MSTSLALTAGLTNDQPLQITQLSSKSHPDPRVPKLSDIRVTTSIIVVEITPDTKPSSSSVRIPVQITSPNGAAAAEPHDWLLLAVREALGM